ncbi:MAG: hypothetical protein J1F02_11510 [Lachnospiraceae bacterium]|nr:hypothetical protein [Lachnospiraceae bacterium]
MILKKLIPILLSGVFFLAACDAGSGKTPDSSLNSATGSAASGSSAVSSAAVSGTAVSEETEETVIVIDETGKKRELKLGNVNEEDAGVYFSDVTWMTDYSQVIEGHYYYLRRSDSWTYTIYRDKGEKVGGFHLWEEDESSYDSLDDDAELIGFAKYGENFFALCGDAFRDKLAYVDLQEHDVKSICNITKSHKRYDDILSSMSCNIYKDAFYCDPNIYLERPTDLAKYNLTEKSPHTYISLSSNAAKAKPYLTYMDGKIYYGVADGRKVTLFSYDLESGGEKEIFHYKRKEKYESDVIRLAMDEDYIYCQDYLIPRSGGKMLKVFSEAKKNKKGMIQYSYNQKYIFYIDKDRKVRRMNKETKEEAVISQLKAARVDCTEDSVYIRVYSKERYEGEVWEMILDDDEGGWDNYARYSDDLYCMDLNGKNVERLWKGGWR